MLAILLAVVTGLIVPSVLANVGALGSCFEGSCSYIAILAMMPLVAAVTWNSWRSWIKCWGQLSVAAGWTVLARVAATLTSGGVMAVLVFLTGFVFCAKSWTQARKEGRTVRSLFVHLPTMNMSPSERV